MTLEELRKRVDSVKLYTVNHETDPWMLEVTIRGRTHKAQAPTVDQALRRMKAILSVLG